ncbi:formylglycine-generating enzyme family protein [Cupriavidus basilensis]|uniref:Formylglycine-generating enzyme family protein n=1 Tax=Cupriavidus basilensis TaxID=68895 RepID=A0ABT6ATZ2_9BURK|nr:formylglycine-generating enzyme family protein [Cupriavidus basilensis]MDF3835151.1 formylglycine-generating enzyme family protein [Cupriavidus basilensis]
MKTTTVLAVLVATVLAAAGAMAMVSDSVQAPPTDALGSERACRVYSGLPPGWGKERYAGMIRVEGGRVTLGSTEGYAEERPLREATVESFWIDRTEVTNAQFASFAHSTGYVTEAERRGRGIVFRKPLPREEVAYGSWWHEVQGADWRHPDGPGSDLRGRENEPVVQVTRADAEAYAQWLGHRLPTEAQWEYAAKAHGRGERIERGPRSQTGRPGANFWQGIFPYIDTAEDGHAGRAPVGCYAANGFGVFDLIGNVWEWTADDWSGRAQFHGAGFGVSASESRAPGLIKGGSFLCSADFCVRYRASARQPQEPDMPTAHSGFRTVMAH